jgi:hypothetical protein
MSRPSLDMTTWYGLRNLVLDAAHVKRFEASPAQRAKFPELVHLLEEYLRTGRDKSIDGAARYVARLCPGIAPEVADSSPWLLLEKS